MMISAIALGICCCLRQTESADKLLQKLPNGLIYRALPNNFVSVQNGSDYWYITKRNNKIVTPKHAHAIYLGVKALDEYLQPTFDKLKLPCVQLRPVTAGLKDYTDGILNKIHSSSGEICGLSSLENKKNLAILNDDKFFIVVEVPYALREVQVKFKSVTVTDDEGTIIRNLPVNLTVEVTSVTAYECFSLSPVFTLLKMFNRKDPKFVKIELKIIGFEGVEMDVDGIDDQAVEALDDGKLQDFIMENVRKRVNSVLEKMASRISREINIRQQRSRRKNLRRTMKEKKRRKKKNLRRHCLNGGCNKWE